METEGEDEDENSMEIEAEVTDSDPAIESETTLDLHTESSLIGTGNLESSLKELCLHQYVSDGVLTLYAVFRKVGNDPQVRRRVGKEAIFSFNKCWVYICLLNDL